MFLRSTFGSVANRIALTPGRSAALSRIVNFGNGRALPWTFLLLLGLRHAVA